MADSPYPELKKTHTPERVGRPWRDVKPPPATPVWQVVQGFASYWTLVAALDLGVFDELACSSPHTAAELAARLDVVAQPLAAVLDGLVVLELLERVHGRYALNDTAERYLTSDGPASMAALVRVANGPAANWEHLADTVRTGVPPAPVDDDASFYLPLVRATFPTQRRVAARTAAMLGLARADVTRILDVGAGGAPWAIGLLEACPASTAVVNDLPGVVGLAAGHLAATGLDRRVELRAGDYRTIEWEPGGYDVVVLGHVCRAEGAVGTRELLAKAWAALRPGGRLLVADYFADNDRTRNRFGVLMGTTMAAATRHGRTPSAAEMYAALAERGFRPVRLLEPIANNQVYVATRPEVPP